MNHTNVDLIRKKEAKSALRTTEKRGTNMIDVTGLQSGIESQDATKRFNQTQMVLRANPNMGLESDSQIINIQTNNNQTEKSRLLNQNSDRDSATDSQPLILEDKLNFSTRIQKLNYHIDILNQEGQVNQDMGNKEISKEQLSVQQNSKTEENNSRQQSETKVIKSHIHKHNKSGRNSGLVISESIKIPSRAQNLAPDIGQVQMGNLQVQGQDHQNQQQNIKDISQKAQSQTDINQYLQQNNKNALRNSLIPQITTDLQFAIQKNSISSMTGGGIGLESVSQSPIGSVKSPYPIQQPSPNPFLPKMNKPQLVHHQTQLIKDQELVVDDTLRHQRMGIEQLKFDKFYSANIMSEKEISQGRNLGIMNKDSILNQSDGTSLLSPQQRDSSNLLQSQIDSSNSVAQKARYKKSVLYNGNNLPLSPSALKVQQGRVRRTHQQRMLLRDDPFSLQNVDNFLMGKQVYPQLHSEVMAENILPYSPSKGQRNQYKCHHQAHPRNHKSNMSANVSNFSSRKNSTLTDIELEQIAALKAAAHLGLITSKSNLGNKDLKIPPPQHRQVQISASMPVQYLVDPVYVNKNGEQPQNLISLSPLGPALLNGSLGQQPLQSEIHDIEHINSITIPNEGVLDIEDKTKSQGQSNLNLIPTPTHETNTQNAATTPQFNHTKLKSISPSNSESIPQYELQDPQVDIQNESQAAFLEKNQASFSAIDSHSQFEQQLQHQQTLKNPKSPSADIFQAEIEVATSKRASQVVGFTSDYLGSQTNMINSNSISQSNISPSKLDQTSQALLNNEQASDTNSLAAEKKAQPQKKKVSNSNLKHKSVLVTTTSQRYNFMSLSFANSQPNESSEGQIENESANRQDYNQPIQEEESESQVSGSSLQKKIRTDQAYQASRKSVIVTSQSRGFKHHTTQNLQLHNGAGASKLLDQISDQFEEEDDQASNNDNHTKQKRSMDKQGSSINPSDLVLENKDQDYMQNVSSLSSDDSNNQGKGDKSKNATSNESFSQNQ